MAEVNVLYRAPRPTKSDYLNAVQEIIQNVGQGMTDAELADRIGCDRVTISNARNMKTGLSPITLAHIGHEFGPEALQPFAEMFGGIIVAADDHEDAELDDITEHAASFTAKILHFRRQRINHTHERPIREALKKLQSKITGYLARRSERRQLRRAA